MKKHFWKKASAVFFAGILACGALVGCGSSASQSSAPSGSTSTSGASNEKVIKVGASPTPHAEILEQISGVLEADGYKLDIVEFNDYVQPNTALEQGDLDANYFQHITYLNDFNEENKTHLVDAVGVHFEPFGLYAGKTNEIASLKNGAKIAVPNDTTNEARALLLLQQEGLIKLRDGAGLTATKQDIVENKLNLDIQEVEAAQLPRILAEVDMAAINGNYAMQGGLNVADAIAVEGTESDAANAYVNVIAVKEGNELSEKTQALVKAITSQEVRSFIENNYKGSVVALF